MDRDNRWERVAQAYHLMCSGKGTAVKSVSEGMEASYANGITDEFVQPMALDASGTIEANDVVICFNFRTDRCREITAVLTQKAFPEENMQPLDLHYCTMTKYDASFKDIHIAYDKDNLVNTLGELIARAGKTQVRIAETEKHPHVTFFFSGGREALFEGEKRLMVNSPKVATYDMQPEMSAFEVRDTICEEIDSHQPDFICLNFANPDMVGHTGDFDAVCKALETVDACTQKVVIKALKHDYACIIIADHGNADKMMNADGSPNTAHTTNPVPVFLLNADKTTISNGKLADVAPTILHLMDIPQAEEMNGKSLI
jgi:2,3-bisphosphoglycerate-independent phosphoglycerate mutase